mgnify:CR=1 FL=1
MRGDFKIYKTVVIKYTPAVDSMDEKIEEKSNEMLSKGYELITMAITGSAKAILVFKVKI